MFINIKFCSILLFCGLAAAQRYEPQEMITCAQLDGVTELPGGKDIVGITQSEDPCVAEDEVAIELSFGLRVSLWKAVRLQRFDNYEDIFPLIELNCRSCSHMVRLKWSQLVDYGVVSLWKNEVLELGEQSHYAITDAISCFERGFKYTLDWTQDGFPVAYDKIPELIEDEEITMTFPKLSPKAKKTEKETRR